MYFLLQIIFVYKIICYFEVIIIDMMMDLKEHINLIDNDFLCYNPRKVLIEIIKYFSHQYYNFSMINNLIYFYIFI